MQFDNSKQEAIEARIRSIKDELAALQFELRMKPRRTQPQIDERVNRIRYHVKRLHEEFPPFNVG